MYGISKQQAYFPRNINFNNTTKNQLENKSNILKSPATNPVNSTNLKLYRSYNNYSVYFGINNNRPKYAASYEKFKNNGFGNFGLNKPDNLNNYFPEVRGHNINVLFDTYMIGDVHLLFMPYDKQYFSICQAYDDKGNVIVNSLNEIYSKLKKMYPDRQIYYFEHGSGKLNGEPAITSTSLSAIHSHGHFVVSPKDRKPDFKLISQEIDKRLDVQSGWIRKEDGMLGYEGKFDSIKETFDYVLSKVKKDKNNELPYIVFSVFEPDGTNKSKIIIKEINSQTVPSQLFRLILSYLFTGNDNPELYDWKQLYKNGTFSPLQLKRLRANQEGIDQFLTKIRFA